MRAIILAAGRGTRMLPLTRHTPKPMLRAGGKPLIHYHVENLVRAGIHDIVINHGLMGDQIESYLGNGAGLHARIRYSAEGEQSLETGGGIFRALPLLGDEPFVAVNADIWTGFPFQSLPAVPAGLAHLVLVPNPDHNPQGDFALEAGRLLNQGDRKYTFSGIGVYRKTLFAGQQGGVFLLTPILRQAAESKMATGELYTGEWLDIGTVERLAVLDNRLTRKHLL